MEAIYCTATREGSEDEWEFLWNKLKNENDDKKRDSIMCALGCTIRPKLIKVIININDFNSIKFQIIEKSYIFILII